MSELAEDYAAMKQVRDEKRERKEPQRFNYTLAKLTAIGYHVQDKREEKYIAFRKGDIEGRFYPYKGWWSAKGIGDGRGINNLVKRLEDKK